MKGRITARQVAFGGLGAAISVLCVMGAYYIPNVSLSLNVVASLGILLPLTQKYYKTAFFAYAVTAAIGGAVTTIHVLPFVCVTGLFPPITILMQDKVKWVWVRALVKFAFIAATFGILYGAAKLFVIDLERFGLQNLSAVALYFIFNSIYAVAVVIYDFGIRWVYKYLLRIVSKMK